MTFLVVLLVVLAAPSPPPPAPSDEAAARRDFLVRCSSCHGREGRGDGPLAAELRTAPANLRTLAVRHGGVFPEAAVRRVLNGGEDIRAHGPPEMPVWGLSFREPGRDAYDPVDVRERLDALVALLRGMQDPEEPHARRGRGPREHAR